MYVNSMCERGRSKFDHVDITMVSSLLFLPDCTAIRPALVSEHSCFFVRALCTLYMGENWSEQYNVWPQWLKLYDILSGVQDAKIRKRPNVTLCLQFLACLTFSWMSEIMLVMLPSHARFGVLRAMKFRIQFFYDVTLCHSVAPEIRRIVEKFRAISLFRINPLKTERICFI
jgi:hypothetical protein